MDSAQSPSPSDGFGPGASHIQSVEILYALGRRLNSAAQRTSTGFLIQQAYTAFAKTLMSVEAYLRFVPSSSFYVGEQTQLGDVSALSTMARQVLDDVVSLLYLCEPNLTPEEEEFRRRVWLYHGTAEYVDLLEFHDTSHPDLPALRAQLDSARQLVEQSVLLNSLEGGRRGRILKGEVRCVLHPDQILERRTIQTKHYDIPHKMLSNFAHFSALSFILMRPPMNELPFFVSLRCVARFFAEAIEVFLETFPQTRSLVCQREQTLIETLRAELRKA